MNNKQLVIYLRRNFCPFVGVARHVLDEFGVPYREIDIDADPTARERILEWTGFLSVPTLVVAEKGEVVPFEPPTFLSRGYSPRGIDRGSIITEASESELIRWLRKHDLIPDDAAEIKDALDREAH